MLRAIVRRLSSSVGHAAVALLLAGGLVSGGMTVLVVAANQTLDASPTPRTVAGPQVSPLPGTLVVAGPTPTSTGPGGPQPGPSGAGPSGSPSGSGGGPAAPASTASAGPTSTRPAPTTSGPAPSSSQPEPTSPSAEPTSSSPRPTSTATPDPTPTTSCPHDNGDDEDSHSAGQHRGKGHHQDHGRGCGHHDDRGRGPGTGHPGPAARQPEVASGQVASGH